jgi:hypothetical protein
MTSSDSLFESCANCATVGSLADNIRLKWRRRPSLHQSIAG